MFGVGWLLAGIPFGLMSAKWRYDDNQYLTIGDIIVTMTISCVFGVCSLAIAVAIGIWIVAMYIAESKFWNKQLTFPVRQPTTQRRFIGDVPPPQVAEPKQVTMYSWMK